MNENNQPEQTVDSYQQAVEFLAGMFGYEGNDQSEQAVATYVVDAASELALENTSFEIALQNRLELKQAFMLHDLIVDYLDSLPDAEVIDAEISLNDATIQRLIDMVKSGKLEN